MSTPFQNRLVGTIIVSAAIVIFLPDILDGEKKLYQADFEDISSAPAFEKKQVNKTFPQEKLKRLPKEILSEESALDDGKQIETSKINNSEDNSIIKESDVKIAVLIKDKTVVTKKTAPKLNKIKESTANDVVQIKEVIKPPEKAKVTQAWVIHLGSFRNEKNVKELLEKLIDNGYNAYTKPIKTKKGILTKVFIGPELIKLSLDKKLLKLKTLTNVQGKVARYQPNN